MEKIIPISNAFGTFIIGNMPKLPSIILQILGNGSVPILFGPNPIGPIGVSEGLLPFNHLIHWENSIIWVPKLIHQTEIDEILRQISPKKWSELRKNGRFIFEHYLGNARVLIRSIFSDIRQRIGLPAPIELATNLPQLLAIPAKITTKNNKKFENFDNPNIFYSSTIFEDLHYLWNKNPTYLDAINPILVKNVHSDLFNKNGYFWVDLTERFTVIICTFRRDAKLAFSLRRLEGIPNLDRILIIWNDIQRTPPPEIFPQIDVPIIVLNGTRNSMLNRFLPLAQIRTEAILILDDDIDIGPNFGQKIHFGFRVWQQNRHRLVGPIFRLGQSGHYDGAPQCRLNMVLTDISFISLAYFRAFNREMSPKIRSIIEKETNCDDIAINFLVAHFTGQSPLKIFYIKNVNDLKIPTTDGNEDANGHKGLANRRNHYQIRSECVKMFTRIFGYNPNIQINYRIDPLWDGEMAEMCQRKEEEEMENYNSL